MVFFADGKLLAAARTDLKNAYPPEARLKAISRTLIHIKPDLFLVFDRIETDGKGRAEWRYHTAYVEPTTPSPRFTAYGYEGRRPLGDPSKTYEEAFKKLPEVNCDVAFLTPDTKASVGMTDAYYRWTQFSQPTRHMKVVREGSESMTLLTAFGAKAALNSIVANKSNAPDAQAYHGQIGDVSWTILVGPGKDSGLESDAPLAVAVHNTKTARTELMRWGGKTLSYNGIPVDNTTADAFAIIEKGKVLNP